MAGWSDLSAEVRNQIYAMILPPNKTLVPTFVDSTALAKDSTSITLAKDNAKSAMFFQPMTCDDATNTYVDDGPVIPAAQYATMTQINRQMRKETLPYFYGSQIFAFPGIRDLDLFVKTLSLYSLLSVRQVSVSARDGNWCDATDYSCPTNIIKKLVPLKSCKNLAALSISLEVSTCKDQNKKFLDFEVHGRPILGCGSDINVRVTACERCTHTRKKKPNQVIQSQHWYWFSAAGTDTWEIVHFIGDTQVESFTQLVKPYHAAPFDDPATKQRLAEELKQKGVELKETRACGETDNHTHLMPDDLRRSRAYWCHTCEVVIFCSYDCAWKNPVHEDYCVPKPMKKTRTELEYLREQYTERVKKEEKLKKEEKKGNVQTANQAVVRTNQAVAQTNQAAVQSWGTPHEDSDDSDSDDSDGSDLIDGSGLTPNLPKRMP